MDPSTSSSLSLSCTKPKIDVFLNYSFEDIGKGFISHLQRELRLYGFGICDHTLLRVGEDVCLELLKAAEESEIFLVVFSGNYASSARCLDELVDIMDCVQKFEGRKVLPVFFKVEPSDVRNQKGPFKEAFHAYERKEVLERVKRWKPSFFGLFKEAFHGQETNVDVDPERVKKWKDVLKEVGEKSGLILHQNEDEAEFLKKVIEELQRMQSPEELHVTQHGVGLEPRTRELISILRLDCKDLVLVVEVSGIGGIGKTTIVKATYNMIRSKFDVSCFLADIHDFCKVPNWKIELPKLLISCLTRNDKLSFVGNHNDYISMIKRLLSRKKVLLVLDDVHNFEQLEAIGINIHKIFSNGSRIIVTTRDKRSLGNIPYVSYVTSLMNGRESLNLFTRLMVASVDTKFVEEVVPYAGGIPLVLEVWSGHFNQCQMEKHQSELEKLKRIPHDDVYKKLKLSYDSLTNRAKKLFLDIACFFMKNYPNDKNLAVKILQDEEIAFFPDNEIQFLLDRSLLKITEYNEFYMHRAIVEMGEEIVRQESEDEPEQRSRLWDGRDVRRVLTEHSGTKIVESIFLSEHLEELVSVEALREMSNLRLFSIECSIDIMTTPLSFKKLKYMRWHGFPFRSIDSINMGNVVVLILWDSKLDILWEGMKSLKKLRILDVRDSEGLTKTGDFYGLENLEELILSGCDRLKELHKSIGCLHKLTILNLFNCGELKTIPWEMIVRLPSLQQLILTNTTGLEADEVTDPFLSSLEEPLSFLQLRNLNKVMFLSSNIRSIPNLPPNITSILAKWCTSLVNLPSNTSELKSLKDLYFSHCPKLGSEDPQFLNKVTSLTNLNYIIMSDCGVSQVPNEIGNLVSLKELDLSGNTFSSLPDSLSNLSQLITLNIEDCSELQSLPLLPANLKEIKAIGCGSLDIMPFDSTQRSYIFRSKACKESTFFKPLTIELEPGKVKIPGLYSYRYRGDALSFVAPMHLDNKICGIVYYIESKTFIIPNIFNKTKNTSRSLEVFGFGDKREIMFYPLDDTTVVVEAGDAVTLEFGEGSDVRCELRLIYDSDVLDSKLVIQHVDDVLCDTSDYGSEYDYESDDDCDSDYSDDYGSDKVDDYDESNLSSATQHEE